jgi:hypothetical protein
MPLGPIEVLVIDLPERRFDPTSTRRALTDDEFAAAKAKLLA